MSLDRFMGVRDFVTVARCGSFTAAAEQLGVTGSALSKSVLRLERRLHVKLLHRTTRRVTLTSEGEIYLSSCLRAMAELEEAESSFGDEQREPAGRVRVDLPAAFGRRYVLPAVIDLTTRYEKLDVSVTFSERKVNLIHDGIDLAVRIGKLDDDLDIAARHLGEQRLVICASPAYLKRKGRPMSKEDLASHDCVIGWRRGDRHQWLLKDSQGKAHTYDVPVRHEMGDGEAILAATLAGCGLSQLPTWLVGEHLRYKRLVTVLDDQAGGEMPIHAIWPKSQYVQPKLRVIIDELMRVASMKSSGFWA